MSKRVLIGVLGVLAVAGFLPTAAEAGTYPVVACQSDGRAFRTHAFTDFATRGMRIRRACRSGAPSLRRGLIAGECRPARRRDPQRARGAHAACPGRDAVLDTRSGRHASGAPTGNYEMEVAGDGSRAAPVALTKTIAGKRCPRRGRAQTSGLGRATGEPGGIAGTDRIVVRVLCKAGAGTTLLGSQGQLCQPRAAGESEGQDESAPLVTITGGDLVSGRWVRGEPARYVCGERWGGGSGELRVLLSGASAGGKDGRLRQLTTRPLRERTGLPSPRARTKLGMALTRL